MMNQSVASESQTENGRYDGRKLPNDAIGLQLHHFVGDRLVSCEPIKFERGRDGVDTVLRRAEISGRVEIDGDIENHFADILDADGSWERTVSLDAGSCGALKNRWMRCKVMA